MKITWLGHSGFRLEIERATILIDPWFTGNPVFPADRRAEAIAGATHVLLTHGHGDHASDAVAIAGDTGATVVGIYDLVTYLSGTAKIETLGFNKGGTVDLGGARVTMVNAIHSSSLGATPVGSEAGYMIAGDGHTLYVSGDTDVTADMGLWAELHAPDIGILCAGGHFTMDMKRAAFAARKFFDFRTVIPCHYRTFPLLEQSADALRAGLPGVTVLTPDVMETVTI